MAYSSPLAAILAEQRRAAAAVRAEPGRGVRLWLADWVAEELAIMEEAMSETKTAGQVLAEADGVTYYHAPGKIYDRQREDWERRAQAVIEWHEAQRPAWPAMRPMGEAVMGASVIVAVKAERPWFDFAYKAEADFGGTVFEADGTFYKETELLGWWPLHEVQK